MSGRPAIPPFQGGRVIRIRLSLGKLLLVNLLQEVKRTNTPLITLTFVRTVGVALLGSQAVLFHILGNG